MPTSREDVEVSIPSSLEAGVELRMPTSPRPTSREAGVGLGMPTSRDGVEVRLLSSLEAGVELKMPTGTSRIGTTNCSINGAAAMSDGRSDALLEECRACN